MTTLLLRLSALSILLAAVGCEKAQAPPATASPGEVGAAAREPAAQANKSLSAIKCPDAPEQLSRYPAPCDHVPIRSWPLYRARAVMGSVVEAIKVEQRA